MNMVSGALMVVVAAVLESSAVAGQSECPCHEVSGVPGSVICAVNTSFIPSCVADNVTSLSIRTPSIGLVPGNIYRFTDLQKLSIENFEKPKLTKSFLSGQSNLPSFQISSTSLEYVDKDWFKYSTKIVKLFLSGNKIRSLDPKTFSYLPLLQVLSLDGNQLATLPPNLFTGPTSNYGQQTQQTYLKTLYLHNNSWHCDSNMVTFMKWISSNRVNVPYMSYCAFPVELEGLELDHLSRY